MTKNVQIIEKIVRLAENKFPESEIYLYGSQARGNPNFNSDWDILVLLDLVNIPFELENEVIDHFYDLELETGEIISPMIYSKNDWFDNRSLTPLFDNIRKEGLKIK